MRKLKIAIDLDGVTLGTIQAWIDQFHPNLEIEDIDQWNVWEIEKANCAKSQFFRELDNISPANVKLIGDAYVYIHKLLMDGHYLFFLTSKTRKMMRWSRQAIRDWDLDAVPMIVTWNKEKYEYDYLLDDSPVNYRAVGDRMVIMTRPWNRKVKAAHRVDDWKEAYEFFRSKALE